ncbi:MAG: lytic transglycosylase domain-containing protein [Xanthomonadales bacterium]|nr:lytic transglycosylase domain-containing protein [Xanthomonadales bacterium]
MAFVSSPKGFQNCKVAWRSAEGKPAAPARQPATAKAETAATPVSKPPAARGWTYEENRADFSHVLASAAVWPEGVARADFRAARGGVASTAREVPAMDFSAVLADVASSAPTVGLPLFVAAPYRMPASIAPSAAPAAAVIGGAKAMAAPAKPSSRVLRGAVYKVARHDGVTEYTNVRPSRGSSFAVLFTYIATCVACDVHSSIDFARTRLNLEAYRDIVAAAAMEYGVDGALLRAVIHAESAFNPLAISSKGAQGLMQLMPGTAGDLGVTDAFDVAQNIRGGARYLSQLLRAFNGDARLATAAYNAGPGAVQKYGGVPPYDETRVYVERVATLRDRYQQAL